MIWTAPKDAWKGETVFILAGGPSLRGFDVSVLKGKGRVIAINHSWLLAPTADILYFCDASWWQMQLNSQPWTKDHEYNFNERIYKGFWVKGGAGFTDHPQVHAIPFTGQTGIETKPHGLRHGSNSGYQSINLAYHYGVARIVLLGYDMRIDGERTHWHTGYGQMTPDQFEKILRLSMLPLFSSLVAPLKAAGIEVLNATPNSMLKCWPAVTLEEVLNPQQEGVSANG